MYSLRSISYSASFSSRILAGNCGTWTRRRIAATSMCRVPMRTRSHSEMARDFSPDLDDFREAVRDVREKPQESRRSEPARDSRQQDEGRTLSRLPEVQESRPR